MLIDPLGALFFYDSFLRRLGSNQLVVEMVSRKDVSSADKVYSINYKIDHGEAHKALKI